MSLLATAAGVAPVSARHVLCVLLAALMLAFSVFLASDVYHTAGLEPRFPHFFGLGYPSTR